MFSQALDSLGCVYCLRFNVLELTFLLSALFLKSDRIKGLNGNFNDQ